jgi:hypothetical protein
MFMCSGDAQAAWSCWGFGVLVCVVWWWVGTAAAVLVRHAHVDELDSGVRAWTCLCL